MINRPVFPLYNSSEGFCFGDERVDLDAGTGGKGYEIQVVAVVGMETGGGEEEDCAEWFEGVGMGRGLSGGGSLKEEVSREGEGRCCGCVGYCDGKGDEGGFVGGGVG